MKEQNAWVAVAVLILIAVAAISFSSAFKWPWQTQPEQDSLIVDLAPPTKNALVAPTSSYVSLQTCTFNSGTPAGWKYCSCPTGYKATGWTGYNCRANGGDWDCGSTWGYADKVAFLHDGAGTAYVSVYCLA